MFLLRTSDATLHHFNSSRDVPYAILFHVWGPDEDTFKDLVKLIEECQRKNSIPRESQRVHDKIRECCRFAERAGYEWVWIDTCCINKDSSAELSEAINSMFAWYADADVCYTFLYDVEDDEDPAAPSSSFRRSRWFTRGWTLQELIAPAREIFLSKTWHTIGSKHTLAAVVEELTGISPGILTHTRSLDSVSVSERMSWAARRQTTRVEDRAYSLLGIFGINIPAIYGEGERAFVRLQEEILRRIPDQTIFAWGPLHSDIQAAREVMERDKFGMEQRTNDPRNTAFDAQARLQDLLAPSPSEFANAACFKPIPFQQLTSELSWTKEQSARVPTYTLTSYGIQIELPLSADSIESWKSWMARTGTATTQHVQVGLLACMNTDGDFVVLFLRRSNNPSSGPQYAVGEFIDGTEERHYHRGALFSSKLLKEPKGKERAPEPRKSEGKDQQEKEFRYRMFALRGLYIHHQSAAQMVLHSRPDGTIREIMATCDQFSFTLPHWLMVLVAERYGLLPMTHDPIDETTGIILKLPFKPSYEQGQEGVVTAVAFADPVRKEKLIIVLGVGSCMCLRVIPTDGVPLHKLWVEVRVGSLDDSEEICAPRLWMQGTPLPKVSGPQQTMPSCKRMHIDFTMVRADDLMIKTVFGDESRRVAISFRKWEGFERIRPILCQTHVFTFEVSGPAYERPSLAAPTTLKVQTSLGKEFGNSDASCLAKTVRFSVPSSSSRKGHGTGRHIRAACWRPHSPTLYTQPPPPSRHDDTWASRSSMARIALC